VKEYKEKCPKCKSNKIDELDCYDNAKGDTIAKMKCKECGHKFTLKMIWIVI